MNSVTSHFWNVAQFTANVMNLDDEPTTKYCIRFGYELSLIVTKEQLFSMAGFLQASALELERMLEEGKTAMSIETKIVK